MLDVGIAVALAIVTALMAYLGVHVTLHPVKSKRQRLGYKYGFGGCAFVAIVLIGWQTFRTQGSQSQAGKAINDLKDLVEKQGKEITALKEELIDRDKELTKINREQLKVAQEQFTLNYLPSVDILYENKQIKIYNRGKTNLSFWGTKLGNGPKTIEKEPRIISPNPNTFYYLLFDHVEKEVVQKFGPSGETRVPFEVFIEDAKQQKYSVKSILWIVVVDGQIKIHTQNTGIQSVDWSK